MTINERVKEVRNCLHLTQKEFGDKTGISQGHLTSIESGKRNVTPKSIKVIALTFNVSEDWLLTGKGEMFNADEKTIAASIASEYGLDETSAKIIEAFVRLPDPQRSAVKDFIINLAEAFNAGEGGKDNK